MINKCPLTGQPCYQPKCIHITEVGPNYTCAGTKDLCVKCGLNEMGIETKVQTTNLFDLLSSIIKDKDAVNVEVKLEPLPGCPKCGYTVQDILTTGRLGCAECYDFFKDDLKPLISKYQGGATQHKGKIPAHKESIEELESKLNEAVKKEEYTKAAELRDKIKKLKSE
jgi:protein arginine kinase activator